MDPISALGIAAAAFQFADVGGKICAKAWEKYKQMRQETDDNQKLAEEEEELSETLEDLSFQVSWMRQISQRINASIPITSTELQLSTLSSQCIELSEKFEQIKNQIKPPNNSGKRSEIHWLEHTRSYRHVREKDCRECQKKKDEEEQEFYRNKDNIEKIKTKLESFKRKAVDFILISLWEDSKDTKRQDLHFSSQLDKLIDLLKCPEELATDTGLTLPLTNQVASTLNRSHDVGSPKVYTPEPGTAVSTVADEEVVRLMTALQPLIQPRDGSLSLKQLAEDIVKTLEVEPEATATIREELIKLLWKTDGKLDTSMTSAKISNNTVARAIVTGMQFSTIRARENAISKNYEATYSWIFQNDPPEKDDVPMWYSFPKWLEDDTKNTYWITGKPGSGKSTIMKLILQQNFVKNSLSLSLGSMRLILVKYYAWSAGTTLQKSIDGLKRTIISQALEQYPELTQALAPRRWAFCQVLRNTSGLPMWTAWELEESFEALLSSCGQRIKLALFIDGLDEFDGPPFEVIEFIQHMMAKCPKGLKVCAASRPWPEFQDEFNEGPMLQMHQLTGNDMKIVVQEKLKNNKGFIEQQQLDSGASSQLLSDIVARANGVFLWVSIVVQHLSGFLSEGQSIYQARSTLETLPADISSLYDAIWAAIRRENLSDASCMIQVLRAYDGPIRWYTLGIIEASRFPPINTNIYSKDSGLRRIALKSLERKLAACTKCILEVSGNEDNGFVDFIHRTARDWAIKPETWQLICSSYSGQFDPHLYILKGETIVLSLEETPLRMELWDTIARILWHAGEVEDIPKYTLDVTTCLNSLEPFYKRLSRFDKSQLAAKNLGRPWGFPDSFVGLVAQFSILPYVKSVAISDRDRLFKKVPSHRLGIFESAVFGYSYYINANTNCFRPRISVERRLSTVRYLMNQGLYRSKMRVRTQSGVGSLQDALQIEMRRLPQNDPDYTYYATVATHLSEKDYESTWRSIRSRIMSWFSKFEA